MKAVLVVLLAAILGVVLYGVIEQHQENAAAHRAEEQRELAECWQNATANGGIGTDLCEAIAKQLDK